jgi:hypothetical protein
MLSAPVLMNNFIAVQSALLSPGTGSMSVTFTNIPSTQRVTFKIANTGTKTAYICGSGSTSTNGIVAAVASTATPQPTSTLISTSTCDAIPAGSIHTLDYIAFTDTISAICGATNSTTLEISIGEGQ